MPVEKRILSIFLSLSERGGRPWTDKEDTQMLFHLLFFYFNGEGNYLFSNLDPPLSIVWIMMLFVTKSLFGLLVHSISQANADTPLNVPRVGGRGGSQLVSSASVKCGTIGQTLTLEIWPLGNICVKCMTLLQSCTRPQHSKQSLCQKKRKGALLLLEHI